MRILGHHGLQRRYRDVPLGMFDDGKTAATLRLYAPSFAVLQQVDDEFDSAEPPLPLAPLAKGVETREDGEPILDSGGSRIAKRDHKAPSHIKALKQHQRILARIVRAKSVALVVLAAEGALEFDAKREQHGSALDYHEAVWAEMEKGGIDVGRFVQLDAAVAEMLELSPEEITTAREAIEGPQERDPEGN